MSHVNLALPGSALQRGFCRCSSKLDDFSRLGDFAIGTLPENKGLFTLYGEKAWTSIATDCTTSRLSTNDSILNGAIVQFTPDSEEEVACPSGPNQFVTMICSMTPSPNYAYAVRIRGIFSHMRLSSMPEQGPGQDTSDQLIHHIEQIHGTLLGFYFPSLLEDTAWAGYRFHFLSEDNAITGRLIDCEIEKPVVALHHLDECRIAIPKTADFQLTDF